MAYSDLARSQRFDHSWEHLRTGTKSHRGTISRRDGESLWLAPFRVPERLSLVRGTLLTLVPTTVRKKRRLRSYISLRGADSNPPTFRGPVCTSPGVARTIQSNKRRPAQANESPTHPPGSKTDSAKSAMDGNAPSVYTVVLRQVPPPIALCRNALPIAERDPCLPQSLSPVSA